MINQELLNRLDELTKDISHFELASEDSVSDRDEKFEKLPTFQLDGNVYAIYNVKNGNGRYGKGAWVDATDISSEDPDNDICVHAMSIGEDAQAQLIELIETYNKSLND